MSRPPISTPSTAVYTSCWCEENIYLLAKHFVEAEADFADNWDAYVLFISNQNKTIAVCQAKGCQNPDLVPGHFAVIWDYHVVLVLASKDAPKTSYVYDFDSRLPMGCEFIEYINGTYPRELILKPSFQSWFRVVPLEQFLDCFASDRSHMLRPNPDGEGTVYVAPPPVYPCIKGSLSTSSNNLFACYVDMDASELTHEVTLEQLSESRYGRVITLKSLQELFVN